MPLSFSFKDDSVVRDAFATARIAWGKPDKSRPCDRLGLRPPPRQLSPCRAPQNRAVFLFHAVVFVDHFPLRSGLQFRP